MIGPLAESTDRLLGVDLTEPELYRNGFPHELFTELRRHGSVFRHPRAFVPSQPDGVEFWAVIGHPEVQRVDRDWKTFTCTEGPSLATRRAGRRTASIVTLDPPAHTRLRGLINSGFTPRMVARLGDLCVRRINDALDKVAEREGECDFVYDVAYQVPMHMIADIVGIPDAERPEIFAATEKLWRAGDPSSPITPQEGIAAHAEVYKYGVQLAAEKRAHPTDDVLSILASAEIETDDGQRTRLQDHELENFFFILTLAGSETTTNAIVQGLVALLEHPDQLASLRAERGLLDTATEEILRWSCPVTLFGRVATRDVELGGCTIRAGERVTMWYPSANRDERAFDEPFRFDIRRRPNPHVSFGGGGVHYCMGANLARLEIRTVFDQLLTRFPDIESTGPLEWGVASPDQNGAATPIRLPVRLGAPA
jgi:cytochrome P450